MEWIPTVFQWYLYTLILGVVFFPTARKLFPKFFDQGYAFSKTIAIVVLSYTSFILGILKLVAFTQTSLYIIVIIFAFANFFVLFREFQLAPFLKRQLSKSRKLIRHKNMIPRENGFTLSFLSICVFEELIFIAALFFLAFVRGQEPSVRGLEKFMDFGFMNAILRSTHFPPIDMWLSADAAKPGGYPINYYYFGHLTGAYLIKLSNMIPSVGYNLILATIFAQAMTMSFSLVANIINIAGVFKSHRIRKMKVVFFGILGSFLVNLAGNLHAIYLFTKGYENEKPVPFWQIMLPFKDIFAFSSGDVFGFKWFTESRYWYPNATRFIPFTIHEFPSYSYVVADLHGHVFDIPFVLLTISLLFSIYLAARQVEGSGDIRIPKPKSRKTPVSAHVEIAYMNLANYLLPATIFLGFLTAVHYMTNAFDGPIYMLLSWAVFFVLFSMSIRFFLFAGITLLSFVIFSYPFSRYFIPFVSGIGVNCSRDFLVAMKKFGPFMFEAGKCQASPIWMIFTLWGFFFTSFAFLYIMVKLSRKTTMVDTFIFILFGVGTFLLIVPEFFYIKDIYPDHFRANTMFKLGYQAYIMMSIGAAYVLYRISTINSIARYIFKLVYVVLFFLLLLYPFFSFPSYYGNFKRPVQLDGSEWLRLQFPEDHEIVTYINTNISGQPVILEAQGDSYTDYERISAYTGVPTVAGWWVHEWLWRGSADVVGKRIPDIVTIYEGEDAAVTRELLKKYHVKYVIVSGQERTKYPQLKERKFGEIGEKVFESSNMRGAVYKLK